MNLNLNKLTRREVIYKSAGMIPNLVPVPRRKLRLPEQIQIFTYISPTCTRRGERETDTAIPPVKNKEAQNRASMIQTAALKSAKLAQSNRSLFTENLRSFTRAENKRA
jgi:hypothetical protein